MQELSIKTNQAVLLSILSGFNIVYLEWVAPPEQLYLFATRVGSTYSAHCTATGKMLLALLPEEKLEFLLQGRILPQVTARAITDTDALREELSRIRERGYFIDDRESYDQMYGVATPIFDHQGRAVAAISCGGFIGGFIGLEETTLEHLRQTSDKISRDLGYRGPQNMR